jgi:hypothetical protein
VVRPSLPGTYHSAGPTVVNLELRVRRHTAKSVIGPDTPAFASDFRPFGGSPLTPRMLSVQNVYT